ncbi:ABC transporter substrate-binding protein [Methylopila sp. Yamaguchi]|uniref:ABC transporter substrate-binding protein n=1 Tax=Methylopila sp. Yamaguchi TaxID=1437817 RepID=UPI000CB42CD1|nr:ABC transporter substrate-binding protein [Methylopila sp. Yamaguchi]GBD46843.1 sulfate ester transport system substrate-binding protein [Methylopila sp. Yamaguchi]
MRFRPLLLGLIALLAATAASAEPLTIRLAFSQVGTAGQQFAGIQTSAIAHARHYLEDEFRSEDVKIEWTFFRGAGPATNEAVANGQIDFFSQGDLPSLAGRAAGLKTKLLANVAARQSRYLAVRPDSDITGVADLRGKKVSQHQGTNITLSIPKILANHGLTDRDVRFINMDNATAVAALLKGDTDAAFGTQQLLELANKGQVKIVYSTKTDDPRTTSNSAFFVTEDFEAKHPDVTYRVVKALTKAAAWASDEANREAVFETWALSGVPVETYRAEFEGQTVAYRNSPLIDDFLIEFYREQAKQAKAFGYVRKEVSVDGWFEPKYLTRAIAELGLKDTWKPLDADGKVVAVNQ